MTVLRRHRQDACGTFHAARKCAPRGFTLLEIMLAMVIAVILFGVAAIMFRGWKSQKALEEKFSGIEACAREAYGGVLRDRRPWMVVFTKTRCQVYDIGGLPPEGVEPPPPRKTVLFDDNQMLLLKRANWGEWKEVVIPEAWRFEPRALLEPIEVRIESPKGWIQGRFDPLSAKLTDVTMEAR